MGLFDWLFGSRPRPSAPPPGRPHLQIAYADRDGAATRRRITIHRVQRHASGDFAVHAYCHLRREPRMFLASRIEELVDLETGEVYARAADYFDGR